MQLFAYNQISEEVGSRERLLIWVGELDVVTPVPASFEILGEIQEPQEPLAGFQPLGDQVFDQQDRPLNHRAVYVLDWPETPERFEIIVRAGGETVRITSKRLPSPFPGKNAESFNLLLSSCYYQPNDKALPLSSLIRSIKPPPDFTLLAGDQVYLDLPSFENLPEDEPALAQTLGKKYRTNWFSNELQQPGLADVLSQGPVYCLPDDHEFWNNFPLFQVQLNNTYTEEDRNTWKVVGETLYERYQMSPTQGEKGFFRRDVGPLSLLFLDGRTRRSADGGKLFPELALKAIGQWQDQLIERKKARQPSIGVLSSGQALLIEKPGPWDKRVADMEMVNYEHDFDVLKDCLETLVNHGIPVLYITGDVHWGRIVEGRNQQGRVLFYEVIASPSRLIDTVGSDQIGEAASWVRGLFGKENPFPKHPEPPDQVPDVKIGNLNYSIEHRQTGDHVALIRFNGVPGGVEFSVDYICTDPDERKRREFTITCGPFKLINL